VVVLIVVVPLSMLTQMLRSPVHSCKVEVLVLVTARHRHSTCSSLIVNEDLVIEKRKMKKKHTYGASRAPLVTVAVHLSRVQVVEPSMEGWSRGNGGIVESTEL
jgi:hypothetical protein